MYNEDYYIDDIFCEEGVGRNINNANYEIINLYERRKKEQIDKKYNKLINKEYESLEPVKLYNELIKNFETNLNELVEKYNTENNKFFRLNNNKSFFKYELKPDLYKTTQEKYSEKYNEELEKLQSLVEEVRSQLSLSFNKDYQIEILTKYGILNEKGFLNV